MLYFRHVKQTGHVESVAIVSEEAIAKGTRRIVALTGHRAIKVRVCSVQRGMCAYDHVIFVLLSHINTPIYWKDMCKN